MKNKMKNTILTTLLLIALTSTTNSNAQVGIGVTTGNIAASAQLDVSSTTKGFLPPRMTYAQRNAIVTPGAGLIIYCADCGSNGELQYYNGTNWMSTAMGEGISPNYISTSAISNLTGNIATCGGSISTDGNATVTARGVCWSTSSSPTIALSTKTVDGTGTGLFTSAITELTHNTTYYVRSYATNAYYTVYGNEVVFTTLDMTIPSISTSAISNITYSTATCGGNISADGNATVTARGVCWSTSTNPTIALSTKTANGTGTGAFTSAITGLADNTTYYVRSFATNGAGTAYGNEVVLTTILDPNPNVTIGTQIWTTQNLNVDHYRNGDIIPEVTTYQQWGDLTTGAWCWYKNDSSKYGTTYGRLYNWYAVNDPRGLAPAGWHIPSNNEWETLTTTLGGASLAGGAMKSTYSWIAPNIGVTNSSGFCGLAGGECGLFFLYNATFCGASQNIGSNANFWSSTEMSAPNNAYAYFRGLYQFVPELGSGGSQKRVGFSVRCIKD